MVGLNEKKTHETLTFLVSSQWIEYTVSTETARTRGLFCLPEPSK